MKKIILTSLSVLGFSLTSFADTAVTKTTSPATVSTKEFSHNCMINSLKISTLPQSSKVTAVEVDLKECSMDNVPSNTYTSAKAYIQDKTPFRDSMLTNLSEAMRSNKRVQLNVENVTLSGGITIPSVVGMNITK